MDYVPAKIIIVNDLILKKKNAKIITTLTKKTHNMI